MIAGSRHEKRWQDIQELIDAGIDVYTTLNVQHLESLNDVVTQITRVPTRETVPDHVLASADQIELIDLPPDDLIKRLHEGKVYVPDAAERAVQHFFSRGNLTALRELAMRAARRARRLGRDQLAPRPRGRGSVGDAGAHPRARRRVRRTARASCASASVSRTGAMRRGSSRHVASSEPRAHRASTISDGEALELAEQLGAEIATLHGAGSRRGDPRLRAARNVTQIVVGRSRRPWRICSCQGSLATALLQAAVDIEVTVASRGTASARSRAMRMPASGWLQDEGYGIAAVVSLLLHGGRVVRRTAARVTGSLGSSTSPAYCSSPCARGSARRSSRASCAAISLRLLLHRAAPQPRRQPRGLAHARRASS
jgi:two-component system sensor histidine kinase KdpD